MSITFRIPIETVSLTNVREHWAKKARRAKAQRSAAFVMTAPIVRMGLPLTVMLTRISPRALDDDNLRGALKSIRDGIADRLGLDDRDERVTWRYAQAKGKERAVEVRVTT